MSDRIVGAVLLASSLSGAVTFYKTFKRRRESASSVWLLLQTVSTMLWTVTYALFFLLPKNGAALFFHDLRYEFVMLSAWCVYLFIYRTLNHRMFAKSTLALLSLIPAANFIVLMTNRHTGLFVTFRGFSMQHGIRLPLLSYGPWFLFHCVFSYIPLFLGAVIIVRQFMRLPAKNKLPIGIILVGMIMIFVMTLLSVFDVLPYPVDLAPLAIQATQAVFYYTLFHSRSMDMMFISRDIIFENTNSVLLVLDTDETIADYNRMAGEAAQRLQIAEPLGMPAAAFVERWKNSAHCRIFEEDPSIFTIVENEAESHYQVQTNGMYGKKKEFLGSYMEIKNVTPIISLIHMLQDAAYYDSLTGLPNRRLFLKKAAEMDKPGSLPLCVIVGDVNRLKYVNDTYGHVKGDELLHKIAEILLDCAPKHAFFARTGGDEFAGLAPNASAEGIERFITEMERACGRLEDPELATASIALGYKMKTQPGEDLMELMKEADSEMYATKRDRRGGEAADGG